MILKLCTPLRLGTTYLPSKRDFTQSVVWTVAPSDYATDVLQLPVALFSLRIAFNHGLIQTYLSPTDTQILPLICKRPQLNPDAGTVGAEEPRELFTIKL